VQVIACAGRDALTAGEARAVAAAAGAGGVILYPTDTLYGLGADPFSAAGIAAVYRLKGRAPAKPLSVLLADASLVGRFAASVPAPWRALMARFWPGPLTLLFLALPGLPAEIRSGTGKVALRVPGSPLCRSILAAAGGALIGTSANPSGGGGTGDPSEALQGLAGTIDLLVDAGTLSPSPASTLLEMNATGHVVELRRGPIPFEEIRRALEAVDKGTFAGV